MCCEPPFETEHSCRTGWVRQSRVAVCSSVGVARLAQPKRCPVALYQVVNLISFYLFWYTHTVSTRPEIHCSSACTDYVYHAVGLVRVYIKYLSNIAQAGLGIAVPVSEFFVNGILGILARRSSLKLAAPFPSKVDSG